MQIKKKSPKELTIFPFKLFWYPLFPLSSVKHVDLTIPFVVKIDLICTFIKDCPAYCTPLLVKSFILGPLSSAHMDVRDQHFIFHACNTKLQFLDNGENSYNTKEWSLRTTQTCISEVHMSFIWLFYALYNCFICSHRILSMYFISQIFTLFSTRHQGTHVLSSS